jgi:hypothetical protein
MPHLDNYQEFVDTEKQAKGLASLAMMIMTVMFLITYLIIKDDFFGLSQQTLKLILLVGASVLFVGSIYVRFVHVTRVEHEY